MRRRVFTTILIASALTSAAYPQEGPKDSVVLIIRHAEDADSGHGISSRGQQRAEAYKNYFLNFNVDSKRVEPAIIFAADDSKKSHRPRLTVQPFAKAANLPIDSRFGNKQSAELVAELRENDKGKVILICWRHGSIPDLLHALGVKPKQFLPDGKWPDSVYNWVILLSFDQDGNLIPSSSRKISANLLPNDS